MQDFDTLRHRVEDTAIRLTSAQSERQQETQALIGILRDLEEKYTAQEKQFAYYKARLEPLEQSNAQLTSLIENLLDLIDQGFGENSLDHLRKASTMASTMLERDMAVDDDSQADQAMAPETSTPVAETDQAEETASVAEPEVGAASSDGAAENPFLRAGRADDRREALSHR